MLYQITEPEISLSLPIHAIGIDLGTTNSVVAYVHEGQARLIPIVGHVLIPSAIGDNDTSCVGRLALEAQTRGESVQTSFKRWMGEEHCQGSEMSSAMELSARLLEYLKEGAERFLGVSVDSAVITVPAYFTEAARAATRDAGKLAHLNVLRLISEPTAAALAYHLDEAKEGFYMVYDLGGGTFDVSLLNMTMGVFQVVAVGGDTHLGGDDMDRVVAEYLGMLDPTPCELLMARSVKEYLSTAMEWRGEARGRFCCISRSNFQSLIAPLIERTLSIMKRVLKDGGVTSEELNDIILVGGASRIPMIQERLTTFLGRPPLMRLDPDHVVALGAALQAEALSRGSNTLLLDVTPLTLGIETMGGEVARLIPRNAPLPTSITEEFTTSYSRQTTLKIHVVQGESERVSDCRSLGDFVLRNLTPLPAGQLRIYVTFTLDADGLLSVTAQEKGGESFHVLQVKPGYGLDDDRLKSLLGNK